MPRTIATNTTVDRDALVEFVRPRHRMLLITRRTDRSPQASPVTGGVDAEGRIVIATYPERAKTRNARRRPEVDVVVVSDEWDGPWVQVSGTCEVLDATADESAERETALDAFEEYFRTIAGEHPDWAEYRRAMVDQGKSLLRVTPTSWGPVATGGFPARLA